jgi:hypothetical protein
MAYEPCSVVDSDCDAPANFEGKTSDSAKLTCFADGEPVCGKCSLIVDYYNYGKQRLCHRCVEDLDGNRERVIKHLEQTTPGKRFPDLV